MEEKTIKEKILEYKEQNPTLSAYKIAKLLNLNRSSVEYHLNHHRKEQSFNRVRRFRKKNPLNNKLSAFICREHLRKRKKSFNSISENRNKTAGNKFSTDELLEKIGDSPICYLTGKQIDLNEPSTYNLDHKIPVSKGGDNSLENCGLACNIANRAKTDMTPEELFIFCKDVLEFNGYKVNKKENIKTDFGI